MAERKKKMDPKQKATMFTIFTLFFPSLLITGIATAYSGLGMSAICIGLFVYQAALIKRYVESSTV